MEEIIDVEEYHSNIQRRSDNNWKARCQMLKDEAKALESKVNKISHANDDLRRQLFEQDHRQHHIASLLGFDDFESIAANVTADDPWIRNGHNRILLLEKQIDELVMESANKAQAYAEMDEQLMDAQDDVRRLRQERDSARREAERQAGDARAWRDELQVCRDEIQKSREEVQFWTNEVNTTLPQMKALIQARQAREKVQPEHPDNAGKENVSRQCDGHDHSVLRDIVNSPCSPPGGCVVSSDPDIRYSKKEYDLLKNKYDDLFILKKKISQRYFEDLKRWKEFKQWLVREDPQNKNTKRRALRRRKAMEDIGLKDDLDVFHHGGNSKTVVSGITGAADGLDVTLPHSMDEPQKNTEDNIDKHNVPSVQETTLNPSSATLCMSAPSPAPLEESLTQSSSIPPCLDHPFSPPRAFSISRIAGQLPLSQESITQASSTPPSPVCGPSTSLSPTGQGTPFLQKTVMDNHAEEVLALKTEPEGPLVLLQTASGPSKQQDGVNVRSISQRNVGFDADKTSTIPLDIIQRNERPRTEIASVTPRALQGPGVEGIDTSEVISGIRRTSTVLAVDTPPRSSALVRHRSSPPDSPHVAVSSESIVRRGKRKAADMDADESIDHGNISDPFMVGSSKSRMKPDISRTREQKAAHLKALGKQSHKEYMANYMPYKGRGRYSGVNTTSNLNVNAEYEIDPSRNDGVNYQFDAVVRDKAGRKNLEAGDCECCRDYYEAIGPLPPRLQPPMWRSPSVSREDRSSRPCRRQKASSHNDVLSTPSPDTRTKGIESHKHDISRHRHDWAPPTTPPSYWQIGFPNTQEVEDINRQADDMHARKLQRVKDETKSKNGRYRMRV